jgi:hypothetical protein
VAIAVAANGGIGGVDQDARTLFRSLEQSASHQPPHDDSVWIGTQWLVLVISTSTRHRAISIVLRWSCMNLQRKSVGPIYLALLVCIERRKDQAHKASIHRLVIELCSDICHTELESVSTKAVDVAASRHTNMRWQYGDMWMRMVPANHTSIALHSNGILLQHVRSIVIFDAIACLTD